MTCGLLTPLLLKSRLELLKSEMHIMRKRLIILLSVFWIALLASTSLAQTPLSATVTVDWTKQVAQSTPMTFGTNDFQINNPDANADTTYHKLIANLGVSMFRFHAAGLSNDWSDSTTRTWVPSKVKSAYTAYQIAYPTQLPTIVQNIPNWPGWMTQQNGRLDPSEYDEYARFCAELVRLINVNLGHHVIYWEPLNEVQDRYKSAGKLNELWTIYNRVAVAMKAVDPTIKVGGPALSYEDFDTLRSFLQAAGPNVDFVSLHRYQTGSVNDSTDTILSGTPYYTYIINGTRATVRDTLGKTLPVLLGEYDINYNSQSGEKRQNTYIGAVWYASIHKWLAEVGTEMATNWNARDGYYGLLDNGNNQRLAATVFKWSNHYFVGEVVSAISSNPQLEGFAVTQKDGSHSLLLINKSSNQAKVSLQSKGVFFGSQTVPSKNVPLQTIARNGLTSASIPASSLNSVPLTMTPYSLVLLRHGPMPTSIQH